MAEVASWRGNAVVATKTDYRSSSGQSDLLDRAVARRLCAFIKSRLHTSLVLPAPCAQKVEFEVLNVLFKS